MSNSTKSIRVGVWGLGRHARRKILPALLSCPTTVLAGVTTRRQDVAKGEAARYGCTAWPTPADMLADRTVEAIYVATPSGLHASHGAIALRAGKHLWCEKPIATSISEARSLSSASRERNLALCEGLMYLYHPQFSTISDLISSGSIGSVLSVKSEFGIPPLEDPGFRTDPSLGGGALLDLAPYPLSAALALVEEPWEIVESHVEHAAAGGIDTSGHALLVTEGRKTSAFLEWGYERAYRNQISIWGELGLIQSELIFSKPPGLTPEVSFRDRHGGLTTIPVESADSFDTMFLAFSEAVFDAGLREQHRDAIELRAGFLEEIKNRTVER